MRPCGFCRAGERVRSRVCRLTHPPSPACGVLGCATVAQTLEIDMEDVPLTLRDLIGAIVIGLALGALIGFAL